MPDSLEVVDRLPPLPAREVTGHKGTFGTVVVVGGNPLMLGAPALVAAGAMRSGAGLVKFIVPKNIVANVLTIEPGATAVDWWTSDAEKSNPHDEIDAPRLMSALTRIDAKNRAVLTIGPGMGVTKATADVVHAVMHGDRLAVLDADALSAIAAFGPATQARARCVLTPHPAEFVRLAQAYQLPESQLGLAPATDDTRRPRAAAALSRASGCIVLLKGHHTIVSDGTRIYVNRTGNPAMATGGSGDVLTGAIGALLAQGANPFDAAVLGAHLHGLAGDLWAGQNGTSGLTARDLAAMLPRAFHQRRVD